MGIRCQIILLNGSSKKIINCKLKVQGKGLCRAIFWGLALDKSSVISVFNFSVYFSRIVTENSRKKIEDKCIEKLKMPPGNFCKRLVPKIWSV